LTSAPSSSRLSAGTIFPGNSVNMTTATQHPYIVCTEEILQGAPIVTGTRTPVRAIAELWKFGVAPEEIVGRLPHLTLAQVFDALSYYQVEIASRLTRFIHASSDRLHAFRPPLPR
jgi:uncharacterized protein (DUF433 family)